MKNIVLNFTVLVFCVLFASSFAAGCGKDSLYLDADAKVQEMDGDKEAELSVSEESDGLADTEQKEEVPAVCFVYICGAVREPGVYEMPPGSRVYEVIEKAGGLKKDAVLEAFNQAEVITDGQMIEIPTYKEQKAAAAEQAAEADGLVNINTATVAELMTLNGIGEAKASAIVTYREEHGAFTDIEQLKNVSGIGESTYANVKDLITV